MQKKLTLNIQLFATSGISGSNSTSLKATTGNAGTLYVSFVENSTNESNNTSNITVYASMTMTSGAFSDYHTPYLAVYWYDNHEKYNRLIERKDVTQLNKKSEVSVGGTFNASHNNDGTLSGYAWAHWEWYKTNTLCPPSGDVGTSTTTLKTIPRATPAPTGLSGTIGKVMTINLSRASSSFTHNLTYTLGDSTEHTIANSVGTVYNWTLPTSFYSTIGNVKTATGAIKVYTYNGETYIGSSWADFTVKVDETSAKLRVSIDSVVDSDNASIALTGNSSKFIAGVSDCKVSFTITSPSSASVKTLKINNTSITTSWRQYTIPNINTKTITISATDSRGYVTNATYTISDANWIAYVPVTIKGTVVRTDGVSGNVVMRYNGNYWTGNFGSVSNSLSLQYRYQQEGGSWSEWLPSGGMSYTTSGTTYSQQNDIQISNININNAYTFQFRAIDAINTSGYTFNVVVDRAKPVAWWNNTYFTVNNILRYTNMSQMSLENLKKNFRELGDVIDVVKNSKIYSYNYQDEKDDERRHYGFVIPTSENSQFEVPDQVMAKSEDGIDTYAMCSILWRAVQQQQEEIEELKKKIV